MTKDSRELLARIGTALYEPDALTRQEADALYDTLDALVAEVERLRAEAQAERAAVVARLRSSGHHSKCVWGDCQGGCHDLFYDGGEHRREEE